MLLDYLGERKKRVERKQKIVHAMGHHTTFVDMVEEIVCQVCDVTPSHLRLRSRNRKLARARYIIFYVAWQPNGFRSQQWLARRYNIDQWSVHYGHDRVSCDPELKQRAITVMALLERRIEHELFGSETRSGQAGDLDPLRFATHSAAERDLFGDGLKNEAVEVTDQP